MSVMMERIRSGMHAVAKAALRFLSLAVLATLITMSLYSAAGALPVAGEGMAAVSSPVGDAAGAGLVSADAGDHERYDGILSARQCANPACASVAIAPALAWVAPHDRASALPARALPLPNGRDPAGLARPPS